MKLINRGSGGKTLDQLASEHFCRLNFKNNGSGSEILENSPISYLFQTIENYMENAEDNNKVYFFEKFAEHDFRLLYRLITTPISELDNLIDEIELLMFDHELVMDYLKEDFENIFKYDNWRGTLKSRWLYKSLELLYCPYCNSEKVYLTNDSDLYVEFDHYYNQARYPYLSLSFYNLIPSCERCNGPTCKGAKPFSYSTHLHPYIDDFHNLANFELSNPILKRNDKFKIKINENNPSTRLSSYLNDFDIENRYNIRQIYDAVINLWDKQNLYNEYKLQEYIDDPNLTDIISRDDAINYASEIPVNENDINKHLYGKLKLDLAGTAGFDIYR